VGGGTASMPRGQSSMAALASLNLGAFKPAAAAPLVELTPAAWTPPLPQGGGSMAPLANLNVSAPRSIAVAPPVQLPPQEANSMAPLAGLNLGAYEPASTAPPILDAAQEVGASAPASVWAPGAIPAPVPTSILIQSTAASGSFPRPSLAAQTAAASRAAPPPPVERGADNPAAAASPPPPRARSTGRDGGLGFSMSDFNNINLSGRRSTGVSKGGGGDGDSGGSSGGGGGDNASRVHTEVHHGHTGGGSGSGSGSRGRERARIALPTDPTLGPVVRLIVPHAIRQKHFHVTPSDSRRAKSLLHEVMRRGSTCIHTVQTTKEINLNGCTSATGTGKRVLTGTMCCACAVPPRATRKV